MSPDLFLVSSASCLFFAPFFVGESILFPRVRCLLHCWIRAYARIRGAPALHDTAIRRAYNAGAAVCRAE